MGGGTPTRRTKAAALVALTFQNAVLALIMKYSRTAKRAHGGHYISSTVVVVTEVAKGVIALILLQARLVLQARHTALLRGAAQHAP